MTQKDVVDYTSDVSLVICRQFQSVISQKEATRQLIILAEDFYQKHGKRRMSDKLTKLLFPAREIR